MVTREDFFPGEAELIRQMFDLGLDWLHLRKPGSGEDDYRALLMELSPYERSRTVLHEHYHLAPELATGGIHANSRHPFPFKPTGERSEAKFADERGETAFPDMSHSGPTATYSGPTAAYSGPTAAMLSVSCHSLEELSAHKAKFDYLFLSPIFDSISKKGYSGRFTREQLLEARDNGLIDKKIIALGGITAGNIPIIRELGFGGVAVLGSVWFSPSPVTSFEELRHNL